MPKISQSLQNGYSKALECCGICKDKTLHLAQGEPILKALELSFAVGEKRILNDISFSLFPQEHLVIIGPNGSGKSTLLKLLLGEEKATKGLALFKNEDLLSLNRRQRARKVALVSQSDDIEPDLEVYEYVLLGRYPYFGKSSRENDERIALACLKDMEVEHFKRAKIGTLSGGELKKVAIARALAQEPQLLLLDEPTNHLDLLSRFKILGKIKQKNITSITVLHDFELLSSFASRVMLMHEGRLIEYGDEEILDGKSFSEVFGLRSLSFKHPIKDMKLRFFEEAI